MVYGKPGVALRRPAQARQTFDPFRTCPASVDTLTSSVPPAVKLAAASANLDILTPRFPARRLLGPARLVLRSRRIQLWLKDESLEDSANLAGLSSMPGFPRHTQSLGASRRKAGISQR